MTRNIIRLPIAAEPKAKLSIGRWSSGNSFKPPKGKLVNSISMEGKLVILAKMGGKLVNCRKKKPNANCGSLRFH
jgi:hypothetical protein